MKSIDTTTANEILTTINTDEHKVLISKEVVNSIKHNQVCKVHLFGDVYLETKKEDYKEIVQRYLPILLDKEEYEICHELKSLKLI
jgi:HD superfamily phosphohydrolase